MSKNLPYDLLEAENVLYKSVIEALDSTNYKLLSVNLIIENLRINPICYRLLDKLLNTRDNCFCIWADEGAPSLAKRDMPKNKNKFYSFNQFEKSKISNDLADIILAVSPQPYDFDQFKNICINYPCRVIMINGRLEDTAVGIGTVGRERRKEFIDNWQKIFWLQPIVNGAIMKEFNNDWELFRLDTDGYRFATSFEIKPDEEMIINALKN
tara:strand:- start:19238 stop:19870 length:633 start_codon:yes stop_codon:yes gene_type:complete